MRLSKLIPFLLVFVIAISCGDPQPPLMTRGMKKRIDTLFQNAIDTLDPISEERCQTMFDSIYEAAVDSIHTQRLLEIESIIDQ